MTIADSVWTATALLHREKSTATDFSVQEINEKVYEEKLVEGFRPGLQVFASKHCVANKPPNPCRYRILFETTRGRRRLFREGDPFHPNRQNGKIRPERHGLPPEYQPLVDWYDRVYSKQNGAPEVLSLESRRPSQTAQNTPANSPTPPLGGIQPSSGPVFLGASGSMVIPETLRDELGLMEGSCLSIYRQGDHLVLQPITDDFIRSLRGCLKSKPGELSLVELREREHRDERY